MAGVEDETEDGGARAEGRGPSCPSPTATARRKRAAKRRGTAREDSESVAGGREDRAGTAKPPQGPRWPRRTRRK